MATLTPLGPHRYEFCARRRDNPVKAETFIVEAADLEEAVSKAHHQGYLIVWVKPLSEGSGLFAFLTRRKINYEEEKETGTQTSQKKVKASGFHLFPMVTVRELISFAVQLSALLQAGVPLLRSLQTVQKGTKNAYFRTVLEKCVENVRGGFALSHALREFPKTFPPVWINLVEVGEASGNLPNVLKDVAAYQEAAERVKGKVISAFFYPSVLVVLATCAVTFLMLKIIPQFDFMFTSLNIKLPLVTQIVVAVSKALREQFFFFAFLVVVGIVGILFARESKGGRFFLDLTKIKMPIMGALVLQVSIVRFAHALSTMIRAGVPILRALEIAAKLVQNAAVEQVLAQAREAVQGGRGLGTELEKKSLFPVFMTQLVSVGEESGELDRFLDLIANYYEERIDTFLARLTTLIEPILLVAIGSVIGVVAVAMILPIVEISTGMH
ncbi:MAG: type II secretion system F family protein [Candidatus Omnitrophica bacterium]|nr:type II secretion system F family protein [Candidatus Omnitrophota bacterium]